MKLVSFKSASKWTFINLQCFNVLWFVFTLKVLFRCKHLLSSRNPSIRLLALDTIAYSCRALQSHQGKQYVILELPLTVYLILRNNCILKELTLVIKCLHAVSILFCTLFQMNFCQWFMRFGCHILPDLWMKKNLSLKRFQF